MLLIVEFGFHIFLLLLLSTKKYPFQKFQLLKGYDIQVHHQLIYNQENELVVNEKLYKHNNLA